MTKLLIAIVAALGFGDGGQDEPRAADTAADQLKLLKLEMTQKELVQVQADIRKLQVERDFWKVRGDAFSKISIPKSALDERVGQDSLITKRQSDVARLREELAVVRNKSKNTAIVERLQAEVATAERDVETLKQSLRIQVAEHLRERAQDEYNGKMTQYQEQIELLKELEKTLQTELQKLGEETRNVRATSVQRLTQVENDLRELRAQLMELKKGK